MLDLNRIRQLAGLTEQTELGVGMGQRADTSNVPATLRQRAEKFVDLPRSDRVKMLYMWVKQGVVNLNEFSQLLSVHVEQSNTDFDDDSGFDR